MPDVFPEQTFVEGVVPGRDRGMCREQRRGPHEFKSLRIVEIVILDVFTESLQTGECRMAFVALLDLGLYAELPQRPDATDTEKQLLLEPVFPVPAIKMMGD